jgi:hypothetical protein
VEGFGEVQPPQKTSAYAVAGFVEAQPPQELSFLAQYGGFAAVLSQKIKISEGLQPSKPPACIDDHTSGDV